MRGYTLVEMLIVLAAIGLLVSMVALSYRTFGQRVDLQTTAQRIVVALDGVRERTLGSENDSAYGIHFETDRYVEFTGTTYNPGASDNIVREIDGRFAISSINLPGGPNVVFDRVTGHTANSGTLTVQTVASPISSRTISIQPLGQADIQGTASPADTRLTDTRHLHFDLGWSLIGSATLRLAFLDSPSVTHDVAMAGYFTADQSKFDWEGAIDVNGSVQRLRIHTHALTASNTTLSIHRDRRDNDKPLTILIDGEEIVSYTAAGEASVGPAGGIMTVQ